jgi:fucose permease
LNQLQRHRTYDQLQTNLDLAVRLKHKYSPFLIALTYLSFVSLGLPDGLNGVAWPSIRAYFHLPVDALGSLLVMFTAGYLISSFSSGRILSHAGLGSLLALSCLVTAISLFGYALAPTWWVMVMLGVLSGLGAGAIDAGLNIFAASQFSARMVNWLHACYGVGAATGPVIMTSVLVSGRVWQSGYAIVACWQLLLAICFAATLRRWPKQPTDYHASKSRIPNTRTLKLPVMWISIGVFFLYTGIEAAAGTWSYTLFTQSRAVTMVTAGSWVSLYWVALTTGRLLAGVAVGFVPANRLVRVCVAGMALGALLIWLNIGNAISFLGLGLMGLSAAPVFPSLIATTPSRLGVAHVSNGVGFQIASAVLGQSLVPALIGVLAGKFGLEMIGPSLFVFVVILVALVQRLTSASLMAKDNAIEDVA